MFNGLFASVYGNTITMPAFLATTIVSLVLGFAISYVYKKVTKEEGTMGMTLICLPFLVQLVILLVNGNLGAGVAVAGAFSLVRFRSAPGTARDIMTIFLAMTVGLACGMGYVALAVLAGIVVCGLMLLQQQVEKKKGMPGEREIRVTVPENLDYSDLFTDLFDTYTENASLIQVKTVNMGSLFCLHYRVSLKNVKKEKELIDQMRCRNQNTKALAAWATAAMLVPGLLTGCGNVSTDSSVTDGISATQSITASNVSNTGTGAGTTSTSQASSENLSKAEVTFTFSDSGIEAALTSIGDENTSEKYEIDGTSLVIKEAGVYVLTGSCTDGNVKVKKGTTGVVLVLNGLTLTSADTAVIACNKSSQVTIEAAAGSENTLTDSVQNNEDNYPDNENVENAVLKCKDGSQVVLCGTGILNINANGKNGIKSGATTTEEGEASLTIKELTLNITAPVNDAINAEQLLNVESGSMTISAADDAVHCDLVLNIGEEGTQGPSITITECNEGLEGAIVNIASGEIDITALDDCINAANSSLSGYDFEINISGGTINAYTSGGDGFDSNADMNISGGTVVVWSANSADNEPLDADGTITISGGSVLAAAAWE